MNARTEWRKAKDKLEHVEGKMHLASKHLHKELYAAKEAEAIAADVLPEFIGRCETCEADIFEGDNHTKSIEGCLACEAHSPMLSDLIKNWEQAIQADSECWYDFEFDSAEEMTGYLHGFRADLAENGDRNMACGVAS